MTSGPRHSRRELLRAAGRGAALAAVAAVGGLLTARGRSRLPGQECTNAGICRGCPTIGGCGLPQALSAKQAGVER
jgi:hypothetical protein